MQITRYDNVLQPLFLRVARKIYSLLTGKFQSAILRKYNISQMNCVHYRTAYIVLIIEMHCKYTILFIVIQ